jgi:hypothetical protein
MKHECMYAQRLISFESIDVVDNMNEYRTYKIITIGLQYAYIS